MRALVGIVLIVPMLVQGGLARLRTRRLPMHFARTAFAFAAMLSMYYGLIHIPVGDVTALSFLIPGVSARWPPGWCSRERVDGARWAATVVGFLGALAIVRPGMESVTLPMLAVLLSCAFYAGAWTSVKLLTATEPASVIVFYMNLMMLPAHPDPVALRMGDAGLAGRSDAADHGAVGLGRAFLPGARLRRGRMRAR